MKLLVFSDSHGAVAPMAELAREIAPDMIVHLGDHDSDAEKLEKRAGGVPVYCVCGNCDIGSGNPDYRLLEVENVRLFITHGHRYNVKLSLDSLLNTARLAGAELALFGHTHRPLDRSFGALRAINPGSLGSGGSCAVIEIAGDVVRCEMRTVGKGAQS